MAYKFSLTREQLTAKTKEIPATYAAYQKLTQEVLVAGVEYAIIEADGSLLQECFNVMHEKHRRWAKLYVSMRGIALTYDKEKDKVRFSQDKGRGILRERQYDLTKLPKGEAWPEDALAILATYAVGIMAGTAWDASLKEAQKEERAANKAANLADFKKQKDKLDKMLKAALAAGHSKEALLEGYLPEQPAMTSDDIELLALAKQYHDILDMLKGHDKDEAVANAVMVAVAAAIQRATSEATKKAA